MTRESFRRNRFWLAVLVGSVLVAGLSTGCTPDVSDLRTEGIDQYRGRQYVESMATLQHVLELSPSDAQANYYMGMNYRALAARRFRDGDPVGARKRLDVASLYFTQAIKSWPNYTAAVTAKNEALEARGKYEDALNVVEAVAQNNRGDAEHFVFLANEYRERGDYDSALRNYKIALAANPDSSRAYEGMGKLYQLIGDKALALDAYRRAYELDPRNTYVEEQLARLSVDSDTHHAALEFQDW